MEYGYVRVSTISQNIDRQIAEMKKLGIEDKNIYIDKQSGKDFERVNYQKLIKILKRDDLVIIKSIDRLGRNYEMIIEEWTRITKIIGADIFVVDMPLLDTRQKAENLVGRLISDIVLQILSFVSENERDSIRQRQAEGIRIAKAKGIHMGRPPLPLPDNFNMIIELYLSGKLSSSRAIKQLKMSKGTFYRNLHKYKRQKHDKNKNNLNL